MPREKATRAQGKRPTQDPSDRARGADNLHLGTQNAVLKAWFTHHGRDLPWRTQPAPGPHPGGWRVLVSEVMLQQTPVDRVRDSWTAWVGRWPSPSALAADAPAEAIRAWGRLGYPRRALRLHAAASIIASEYGDLVPADRDALRSLPGVGDYTAGAVRAFAYGERDLALDTNVRRVIARHDRGRAHPEGSVTQAEKAYADSIQPGPEAGAAWVASVMELGALVCTARQPACGICPIASTCRWLALGCPEGPAPRRQPRYEGSDRQARGALLGVLRQAGGPVTQRQLDRAWPDPPQRARALDGLVADGLVVPVGNRGWSLPR